MLSLMTDSPPDFIGAGESCAILKVHRTTLTRWVAAGVLKVAHKLPGENGAFLFNRADVEALRDQREQGARDEQAASA